MIRLGVGEYLEGSPKNYAEGVSCPLLTALGLGVVYIEDSLTVTNCGFFEKFERKLHIVRDNENNNID